MLDDDPFELGVERLNELRVAGTVFEGLPQMLARQVAYILSLQADHAGSAAAPGTGQPAGADDNSPIRRGRYRHMSAACCGISDRCDIVRQWGAWIGAWFDQGHGANGPGSAPAKA